MVVAVKNGAITTEEQNIYIDHAIANYPDTELSEIIIEMDGSNVILHCFNEIIGEEIIRVKRIPGFGG